MRNMVLAALLLASPQSASAANVDGNSALALAGLVADYSPELYATIDEVGVSPDRAAGSVFESLSNLNCTIDPNEITQKAGGGASCTFDPGATSEPGTKSTSEPEKK